jgi:hypothetical protein
MIALIIPTAIWLLVLLVISVLLFWGGFAVLKDTVKTPERERRHPLWSIITMLVLWILAIEGFAFSVLYLVRLWRE